LREKEEREVCLFEINKKIELPPFLSFKTPTPQAKKRREETFRARTLSG
jgi:hypothetical protein